MDTLKSITVDLLALITIAVLIFTQNNVLEIVVWVYTGLLLVGKITAFFMPSLQKRANKTEVSDFIYHVMYGLSTGLLIYGKFYYLAVGWALIWCLSILLRIKSNKK